LVFDCLLETNFCGNTECFKAAPGDIMINAKDGSSNITLGPEKLRYTTTKDGAYFDAGVNEVMKLPGKENLFINYFCSCVPNITSAKLKCETQGSCFKIVNAKK
jgi:hypothetical protein